MEKQPISDIFATQGLLAVLAGILILVLNLAAPQLCADLLEEWRHISENSLYPEQLWAQLLQWWSAIWSV